MIKIPPYYIRATDAAGILNVQDKTVIRMIKRGELKARRTKGNTPQGNKWQIDLHDVYELQRKLDKSTL